MKAHARSTAAISKALRLAFEMSSSSVACPMFGSQEPSSHPKPRRYSRATKNRKTNTPPIVLSRNWKSGSTGGLLDEADIASQDHQRAQYASVLAPKGWRLASAAGDFPAADGASQLPGRAGSVKACAAATKADAGTLYSPACCAVFFSSPFAAARLCANSGNVFAIESLSGRM